MKLRIALLTALAFATGLMLVQAEDDPGTRPPKGLPDALKPYDVDGDGKLSAEEWRAFINDHKPNRPPNPVDLNGDGTVTPEEIAAYREELRKRLEEERSKRFDEADLDDDGFLSLEEFTKALPGSVPAERAERLFNHCDADGDGLMSKEEFLKCLGYAPRAEPPRPPKPRPPQPPGPHPLPDFLKPFDLNGDGILSRDEIQKAIADGTWPFPPPTDPPPGR
jgi:Ca2+-binding EF-hand superfamily protein